MTTGELDPLIHVPTRLKIVATLAALPDGDTLSFTRLQDMTGLPSGRLVAGLHELGHAGYVRTGRTADGGAQAAVALTRDGRAALDRYTAVLRQLARLPALAGQEPAPGLRAGDADRDAAAAALAEHFAQGRLTLDELSARLDATLTAATYGELSQAVRDLPDLVSRPGGRARASAPPAAGSPARAFFPGRRPAPAARARPRRRPRG